MKSIYGFMVAIGMILACFSFTSEAATNENVITVECDSPSMLSIGSLPAIEFFVLEDTNLVPEAVACEVLASNENYRFIAKENKRTTFSVHARIIHQPPSC